MPDTGKKFWSGVGQWIGAFFDKKVVKPWIRWTIFIGIAFVIFWQSGWDWWYVLKVIAGVLWVLLVLVVFFIVLRRFLDKQNS